jgi:Mg-chelatase subunit ChlD
MVSPFECPITLETMKDPVLAPDGHTYERSAIVTWLRENGGKSPQTRERMYIADLVPNRALRDIIDASRKSGVDIATAAVAAAGTSADADADDPQIKPIVCSEELYQTIVNTTEATVHTNSFNSNQSIVHVETPNLDNITSSSHICCVIDVSGSMAAEARCKDEGGMETRTGLTILDVVKFATLVISKSLEAKDKLSIVTYSSEAETVLSPTNMDANGKREVERVLSTIKPLYMTNLWDGMKMGVGLCSETGNEYVNSVFVLTDGIPNVHPPIGYQRALTRLLKTQPLFGAISTFGFSDCLDSPLLVQIAKDGGGYFSYIPDAGFVGTCFINAVANARCVFGLNSSINILTDIGNDKEMLNELSKLHEVVADEDILRMKIAPLRYGAPIDLFINHGDDLDMELVFHVAGGREVKIPIRKTKTTPDANYDMFHHLRYKFVTSGQATTALKSCYRSKDNFRIGQDLASFRDESDSIDAICKDMEGQATEAVSNKEYYETWGRHYLFSLIGAHLHQFCNNFKDPGVQVYGKGDLFISLQEDLNDIFETVPAPKPSSTNRYSKFGSAAGRTGNNISMKSTFNNSNAVCFHGKTKVTVKSQKDNGSNCENDNKSSPSPSIVTIPIASVKKGDLVLTENGFARVQCLVETVTETPLKLVKINSLEVTPYHPIKISHDRSWEFPIQCQGIELIKNDSHSVYNLVLQKEDRNKAIMMENGIAGITLGHGINTNAILKHEYFGTDLIVHDLQKITSGWDAGHIVLQEENIKRAQSTGNICCINVSKSLVPCTA